MTIRKSRGFTLIELLVVIAIIALLMAMLMPTLSRAKEQTRAVICLHNLHQWGVAWKMYFQDWNHTTRHRLEWLYDLRPYYKNEELLLCPSAKKPYYPATATNQLVRGGKFKAWSVWQDNRCWVGSYGINMYCTHHFGGGRAKEENWLTANVREAAYVPLLLDSASSGLTPLGQDKPPTYDGEVYYSSPTDINEIRGFCINRHLERVNCLFLDFHVRPVGLKELWVLTWHHDWPVPLAMTRPTDWNNPNHWMFGMKHY